MVTPTQEAETITKIIGEYLTEDQAKSVMTRLHQEVGSKTDNVSLKTSFQLLKTIYDPPPPKSKKMQFALWATIIFHMAIIFGNLLACMILPFVMPWFISLPLVTLICNLIFSPIPCPLTKLESLIRRSLGMPEIRYFIKHYIVDPVKKLKK